MEKTSQCFSELEGLEGEMEPKNPSGIAIILALLVLYNFIYYTCTYVFEF